MGHGRGVLPGRVFPLLRGGDPEGLLLQERRALPGEGSSGRGNRGFRGGGLRGPEEIREGSSRIEMHQTLSGQSIAVLSVCLTSARQSPQTNGSISDRHRR